MQRNAGSSNQTTISHQSCQRNVMTRKLATIRAINSLIPIKDADLIELAKIDGWQVVIKKGEFESGDLCVYFEIDSWIPTEIAPFLSKGKEPKTFNNVPGERLRTIKLKGQLSQGLAIPLHQLSEETVDFCTSIDWNDPTGIDLTEHLNIQLYEKPVPAQLAGMARGNFPPFIPKTDQERIQNIPDHVFEEWKNNTWEITEKLDGSSMTIYLNNGEFGICSRNLELKLDQTGNTFVDMGKQYESAMRELELNIAIQGELIGPGIQGNQYSLPKHEYRVFDIFDINNQKYYTPAARHKMSLLLDLFHAPIIKKDVSFKTETKESLLAVAEGNSRLNTTEREGLVFKNNDNNNSFKVISNKWLLNEQ
jgi:RNA ligase (TIGR02306 family)